MAVLVLALAVGGIAAGARHIYEIGTTNPIAPQEPKLVEVVRRKLPKELRSDTKLIGQIVKILGEGGEGRVLLVLDKNGRLVAYKEINSEIPLYPGVHTGDFVAMQLKDGSFVNAKAFVIRENGKDTIYDNFEDLDKRIKYKEDQIQNKPTVKKLKRELAELKGKNALKELIQAKEDQLEAEMNLYRCNIVGIIMEPLKGEDLMETICNSKDGKLDVSTTIDYSLQTLKGLQIMHKQGLSHRDIKPSNLFVAEDGTIKFLDFGFTRQVKPGELMQTTCGTCQFMAPEILTGKPYNAAVDSYSAGITMFCMVTGQLPFHHPNESVMIKNILEYGKGGTFEDIGRPTAELMAAIRQQNPILADVITGLTMGDPSKRMSLEVAIQKLEAVK